jgi:hypothetical protein
LGIAYVMTRLARFRADPSRVRVSLRRVSGAWDATVASRETDDSATVRASDAETALALALESADDIPGVDLEMQWAYEHPWPR